MSDVAAKKRELRQELRRLTKDLDEAYVRYSNEGIEELLYLLPEWKAARTVFLYISMGNEPHTHGIFHAAVSSGKRVGVPRCLGNGIMEAREVKDMDKLTPKSFGILEPNEEAPLVAPGEFDLVVAPCLAADQHCYRLGNGGGYYDRFLPSVKCPVICLCRGRLLQTSLPKEEFDVPVDMVLTEWGSLRRRR